MSRSADPRHGTGDRRRRFGPPDADDDRPRLFFAIPVPEPARDAVAAMVERVQAAADGIRARWVRFENLHLTLRFLGPTEPEAIPALGEALAAVARATAPFEISLRDGGAFPNLVRPRTLWVGLAAGGERVTALAEAMTSDARVAPLIAAPSPDSPARRGDRFSPHLTIARTDGVRGAGALARRLQVEAATLDAKFLADRAVLYRSHMGSGPARYEPLHEAPLGG